MEATRLAPFLKQRMGHCYIDVFQPMSKGVLLQFHMKKLELGLLVLVVNVRQYAFERFKVQIAGIRIGVSERGFDHLVVGFNLCYQVIFFVNKMLVAFGSFLVVHFNSSPFCNEAGKSRFFGIFSAGEREVKVSISIKQQKALSR
jgi:hypothetical protein